ncbi:uncharacterized protein LOC128990156 [Macrosteles quadrilineatus]|uniref:uncharacterized protein LOC128990156 n=1 Tax=Macrosteles quadrilineatus TaxID=74068 RepID=UPI0023E1B69B|nr:uncharacterized protein LOC128990156 [Macrosteles quadrilineatus]
MDWVNIVLLTGCFLSWSGCTSSEQNMTQLMEEESLLPVKERFRRLIPYMTYYLDQGYNTQAPQQQYVTAAPQYDALPQQINNNLRPQPYYVPQYQPQPQQKYQLVPVGYLVGGGYRRVPVYSRPQSDYQYTPQNPSDLTRMITQNYLSIAKQVAQKDQRPTQFTTKLHYANENPSNNQQYKSKNYYQPRHRPQNIRQPYIQKSFRPTYSPLKENTYVQLHNNYESNFENTQNIKSYVPDPVMTITKSQEINVPEIQNIPVQIPVENQHIPIPTTLPKIQSDYEQSVPPVPTVEQNNLLDLLAGYQLNKALPEKVTPSNIGYSIQTLTNLLKLLQKVKGQPTGGAYVEEDYDNGVSPDYSPQQTEGSTPGRAGIDYPAYSEIPETHFTCKSQRYKGFFGDPETNCQVWHYCDLNGGQASFLCPNGTIFSQVALTCDWWFNVKCESTSQLYVLNERLYKYILPVKPSFPEDYAGPLVDEYLTLKFQEIEAKKQQNSTTEKSPNTLQVLLNDEVNQAVK